MYSTFISVESLHEIMRTKSTPLAIVDCRFYLSDLEMGYNEYLRGHIPLAIYAHLDHDLSGPVTSLTGRHPLPDIDDFKTWIKNNNITKSSQIIVYDQSGGGIASRLWWMLIQVGYKDVAVLEGGIIEWKKNDLPMTSGIETREDLEMDAFDIPSDWSVGPSKLYSRTDVQDIIDTDVYLIDSRSPERYSGQLETIDPIAGHIPSATNIFWQSHLEDNLKLKPINLIKQNLENTMGPSKESVFYCGSGVTAAFNVLVAKHIGHATPGIYIGSWSEWIRE